MSLYDYQIKVEKSGEGVYQWTIPAESITAALSRLALLENNAALDVLSVTRKARVLLAVRSAVDAFGDEPAQGLRFD